MKKNILVTGGLGYIGCHVVNLFLSKGHNVTVVDNILFGSYPLNVFLGNNNFFFYKTDVRDRKKIEEIFKIHKFDVVVHLAALVGEAACKKNVNDTDEINYKATLMLAELSKIHHINNFIFMSTASSYGIQNIDEIADENTKLNPVSEYAISKINSERDLLQKYSEDMNITIFRPSTVHGTSPRMRFDLIVNHLTLDAYKKNEILVLGPKLWRPLMSVSEPSKVFDLVINSENRNIKSQIFNLGSDDQNFQKINIAENLKKNFFKNLKIEIIDKDPDLRSYRVSFKKIKDKLKFDTSRTLTKSIEEIVNFLNYNNEIKPESKLFRNA